MWAVKIQNGLYEVTTFIVRAASILEAIAIVHNQLTIAFTAMAIEKIEFDEDSNIIEI